MIDENYIKTLEARKLSDHYIRTTEWALKKNDTFHPLETMTKNDLVEFFRNFDGSESSLSFFQTITKQYFKFINKFYIVDWLKIKKAKETLNSKDILTTEDINKLIEATNSHFYKALIAFLFETGCRISEAKALKYSDLKETDRGVEVNIKTTKTSAGYRALILPFSGQYIRILKSYTNKNDNDTIFKMGNSQIGVILKKTAKKAGINKPVSPHKFRHAQATDMVKRGYNEAIIRKKHGWTPQSNMIARYQHLDDNDVINATLEKIGKLSPSARQLTEIKEAEKLNIVEEKMLLSKFINQNEEIQDKFKEYDLRIKEYEKRMNYDHQIHFHMVNFIMSDEKRFEEFSKLEMDEKKYKEARKKGRLIPLQIKRIHKKPYLKALSSAIRESSLECSI